MKILEIIELKIYGQLLFSKQIDFLLQMVHKHQKFYL